MPIDVKRVQSVFLAASEIADPAERARFLDGACDDDTELKSRVEALLRALDQPDSLLDHPAVPPHDPNSATTRTIGHEGDAPTDDEVPLGFLAPATRPDSLGRIGHYEVLQVLGKGGFGIVFRAFDDILQRVVAVKVLSPQMAATSPARKRFLREARTSAQVRHENVVQVYEVGEQPLPYIAMEFIPGETLQQRLDRTGPVDVAEVVRIGREIAEGLAAAHATDLIHRDIKPGNVLLEGGQLRVKLTDFGLARAADDASISQSGIVAGTPMYMAPEQAKGETLDQRADLFSLGSVLYVMAAGRAPFRANGTLAVLKRVAEDTPRPIREIIPETPQWLCDIISKLHAKNPDDRFPSARAVADVLADCEAQLKANAKLKDFSRIPQGKPRRSGRWKWVAVAAVLMLPMIAPAVTEIAGVTHLFRGRAALDSVQPGSGSAQSAEVDATKDAATPTTDSDRFAAEWVLSRRGVVKVNEQEQEIKARADLPREPFRLTSVDLDFKESEDYGLANFKGCKNLVHLNLNAVHIFDSAPYTDAGLANFTDCKNLTSLKLNSTGVTDAGLLHFKVCKNITNLSLGSTGITDTGLALIAGLDKLTDLDLGGTKVTAQGINRLAKVLPGCAITWDGGAIGTNNGPDRRAAEYVLSLGGTVKVNEQEQEIKAKTDLPRESFRLSSASIGFAVESADDGLASFKGCKNLVHLSLGSRHMEFPSPFTDKGLAHFKDCKRLRSLSLGSDGITDAGLVHFKECKELTSLSLGGREGITAAGLVHFKECKNLTNLFLGNTGVTDLLHFKECKNLTNLELNDVPVADAGLALVKGFNKLTQLVLSGARVRDANLVHFKGYKKLTHLRLAFTGTTDAGMIYFKDCKNLIELDLGDTRVSDAGIAAFMDCKNLENLTLRNTQVGDVGLAQLKDCKGLKFLGLGRSKVTDAGLVSLKNFKGLTSLGLDTTRVSDAGLAHLAGLDNLTDLRLTRTKVTAQGVKGLAKVLPGCAITWDDGVIGPNNGEDRRVAGYVLWLGGVVEVEVDRASREIKAPDKLPPTAFRLKRASLGNNVDVTDAGLGTFKECHNLHILDLTDTLVTDAGLAYLDGLSELKNLLLAKTRVTAKGVEGLAKALPKCKITWDGGVIGPQ